MVIINNITYGTFFFPARYFMSQGHNLFFPFLLLIFSTNSYALEWQDLWQTQDQQAENAFQQKQYEQAAEQFSQAPWKAAAQYESGQYQQVLETLNDMQSGDAFYNKGNAHARLGQFKEALTAYNKALQLDPENSDAQYNKELIEKELEKQEQQQDQQKGNGDSDQQKQDKEDSQDQEQQKQSQDSSQDQNGEQQENQDEQGEQSDRQKESDEQQTDQDSNGKQSQQTNEEENEAGSEDEQSQGAEQSAEEDEQQDDQTSENAQTADESSEEEQQANEQWLKRIPDDPAGLLRRKFKYQYKQRQTEPNRQAEQW
jgi:Ca-activated chloride channel family protein